MKNVKEGKKRDALNHEDPRGHEDEQTSHVTNL